MRVKTSELEGAALDWAVAKALGATVIKKARFTNFGEDMELFDWVCSPVEWWADSFQPSTNWSQGGPLIDRYKPALTPICNDSGWCAEYDIPTGAGDAETFSINGPTPLIAAMRTIAAAELGDEVDVPEELCSE